MDIIECRDWLRFAGVDSPQIQAISREQQFAEKLHAYTLPRSSANSRVKDLVDLALLIKSRLNTKRTADAVHLTFDRRRTHELSPALPKPPQDWQGRFIVLAEDCQLQGDMDTVFSEIEEFFERMMKGRARS